MKSLICKVCLFSWLVILSVSFGYALDEQIQKAFEERYQGWRMWVENNKIRSFLAAGPDFQEIVALGPKVVPYLVEKIEKNPGDFHLEHAIYRIIKKDFEKNDWPQNKLGDSITAAKMYVQWWKEGRFKTGGRFAELYSKWKTLKLEKKDKEAKETYRQIVNLGIPVLPYLVENVETEPEFIPAISKLTDRQLPATATGAGCKQWWQNNKQKWELPNTSDNRQKTGE